MKYYVIFFCLRKISDIFRSRNIEFYPKILSFLIQQRNQRESTVLASIAALCFITHYYHNMQMNAEILCRKIRMKSFSEGEMSKIARASNFSAPSHF
mmetsp:Transcript_11253/g.23369  ORF Transcript_11253/g.23369 Transcript_11253/m.23369 type:complete len:97 (-) Transcript_11253:276-566(-)